MPHSTGIRRTIAVLSLVGAVSILQGCTTFGIVQVSEPKLAAEKQTEFQLKDDILAYRDITISVKPQNYYVSFVSIGPILPVIPMPPFHGPVQKDEPFQVVVQFDTVSDGYALDPTGLLLYYQHDTFRPVDVRGPYFEEGYAREVERMVPGHTWRCFRPTSGIERGLEPRPFKGKVCFDVTFPLNRVPTENEFRVTVGGIAKNGELVPPPVLEFRPGSRSGFNLMMSQ